MNRKRVLVVGGGVAGLCSALALACHGYEVELFESDARLGGKAAERTESGLTFDTGPSVLTLPEVFDRLFARAGTSLAEQLELRKPSPNFRYLFPSGVSLDVESELEETRNNVRSVFGQSGQLQFDKFLSEAKKIWESAQRYFIFAEAPDVWGILRGGPAAWLAIGKIDGMRNMQSAIESSVQVPELRMLLERYATYNGSDVRRAPATLNCIAHVELALGGFGVQGGMYRLVETLVRLLEQSGVALRTGQAVEQVVFSRGRASGVLTAGRLVSGDAVVVCGEASALPRLGVGTTDGTSTGENSMSGYTGVFSVRAGARERAAHTVLFPKDYLAEFREIFDERSVPSHPTIYLCAQSACHGRAASGGREAVFVMVNAPPSDAGSRLPESSVIFRAVRERLLKAGLLEAEDELVWTRDPKELAKRFPGSDGSLYGLASNDRWSAFQRRGSRVKGATGVYFAHGSGHPGGGLPLVAQSGILAADAVREDLR